GDVLILNDSTLEEKCSFSTQTGLTHSVAFAPNQRFVALGDRFNMTNSGRIDIWDITNEERVGELESHQSTITTMAFSPDSSRLVFASSAHNRVWLWSIGSGEKLILLKGLRHDMTSLAFSLNGDSVAAGDSRGVIKVWELNK